jgi:hypothetical protein
LEDAETEAEADCNHLFVVVLLVVEPMRKGLDMNEVLSLAKTMEVKFLGSRLAVLNLN